MSTRFEIHHLEAYRFLLTSLSNPENTHLVDLEEYDGFGECSCEYFHFKLGPKLKAGKKPLKVCRHIRSVRQLIQKNLPSPR